MEGVSIIISTKNQQGNIGKCVESCLRQSWPIEVIAVDDGSTDGAMRVLKGFGDKIRVLENKGRGRVVGINRAIRNAKYHYVCLSAGDIELEREFVRKLMRFFDKDVAFVSPFTKTGGNSTIYRKDVITRLGFFDERFNVYGSGFRDDTDMAFQMFDAGFRGILTHRARFRHASDEEKITGVGRMVAYSARRVKIHTIDPLLYKKHPARAGEFLDIKLRFLRNPAKDFRNATGTWHRKGRFSLRSPQGVTLMEGNAMPSRLLIFAMGLAYVFLVKLARLYGSIKYWKLLI
ncbi:MAG: glycosyltransferase [Candidatus Aenigmarchaeota archaeon]|nr:glycosyltransferase [Candidatus Aenigmarchaeota archaeon]